MATLLPKRVKCRLAAELIGNLGPWLNRKEGEIDYFLTILLSLYESFQSYSHKIGKVHSTDCVFYNAVMDDEDHNFFKGKGGWDFSISLCSHRGSSLQRILSKRCQGTLTDGAVLLLRSGSYSCEED